MKYMLKNCYKKINETAIIKFIQINIIDLIIYGTVMHLKI